MATGHGRAFMVTHRKRLKSLVLATCSTVLTVPHPASAAELDTAVAPAASSHVTVQANTGDQLPSTPVEHPLEYQSSQVRIPQGTQTAVFVLAATEKEAKPDHKKEESALDLWVKLLEAIAKVLSSIAWPAAAVIMVGFFRKELASLMARIRKVKAGSAEAEFTDEVHKAAAERLDGGEQVAPEVEPDVVRDAALDPRGVILNAWLKIEHAASRLYQLHVPSEPNRIVRFVSPHLMRDLAKMGVISKDTVKFYHELQQMRNQATHELDFSPDLDSVVLYVKLAHELHTTIENAIKASDGNDHSTP